MHLLTTQRLESGESLQTASRTSYDVAPVIGIHPTSLFDHVTLITIGA